MKIPIQFSFSFFLFFSLSLLTDSAQNNITRNVVDVGVILDVKTPLGNMSASYISMALSDLHAHHNFTTELNLTFWDSNEDSVEAASIALDRIKNKVKAIIGPQTSAQAQFVIELGNKAHVPILSFSATSPFLSSINKPYFIPTAPNDSSQVRAITAIIQAFRWKQVVPIYEDTHYGAIPNLTNALQDVKVRIPYNSVIPQIATDDQIGQELSTLEKMQTRVFVVHLSPSLGSRFFLKANEAGMMSEGYAWIITASLANLLDSMNLSVIRSMQGVLGVRPYFPQSQELEKFMERWKSNFSNVDDTTELSIYGLWAYDTVWTLAKAVERVRTENSNFLMGPRLLNAIIETNFEGLSGGFNLNDGQLEWTTFQIVNVIGTGRKEIGFWTPDKRLQKKLNYSSFKDNLGLINWPGDLEKTPSGWKNLTIGFPNKKGFKEFVSAEKNLETNRTKPKGYSIEVFEAAINKLPYQVYRNYVPYEGNHGNSPNYDDLVEQVYIHQKFDAVVGDVTIIANRSLHVDFTLPYTESGVTLVVLANDKKKTWNFLKPFSRGLWFTTGAGFALTGIVVWALEHRINDEFRGPPSQQVGVMLWFSFSTLVFAHRERLKSNWSRLVVIIWVFVAWIVTSSYTASFTSLLTLQQLQPTINDIKDLINNGHNVGYQTGSFVRDLLLSLKVDQSKLRPYATAEEFAEALSKGTVGGILDEIPYLRLFLAQNGNCAKYKMVGPIYKTDGFGFVFPKGFPLVPDLSWAILNLKEEEEMQKIEHKWNIGSENTCSDQHTTAPSNSLTLDGFKVLFIITGLVSVSALLFLLVQFLYENRDVLRTRDSGTPFIQRLISRIRRFDERDLSHHTFRGARPNEGWEMGIRVHGGNCPPVDASMEPSSSNPNRRDSVVTTQLDQDDARHFQTSNCQTPARRRWNQLYKAWRFRTHYARLHDYN